MEIPLLVHPLGIQISPLIHFTDPLNYPRMDCSLPVLPESFIYPPLLNLLLTSHHGPQKWIFHFVCFHHFQIPKKSPRIARNHP